MLGLPSIKTIMGFHSLLPRLHRSCRPQTRCLYLMAPDEIDIAGLRPICGAPYVGISQWLTTRACRLRVAHSRSFQNSLPKSVAVYGDMRYTDRGLQSLKSYLPAIKIPGCSNAGRRTPPTTSHYLSSASKRSNYFSRRRSTTQS